MKNISEQLLELEARALLESFETKKQISEQEREIWNAKDPIAAAKKYLSEKGK